MAIGLGYGGRPFTVPEVPMSNLKLRLYPVMIVAASILAATGGGWRIGTG